MSFFKKKKDKKSVSYINSSQGQYILSTNGLIEGNIKINELALKFQLIPINSILLQAAALDYTISLLLSYNPTETISMIENVTN